MDWLAKEREGSNDDPKQHNDQTTWVLLIVDDEEGVHTATKLALKDFRLGGMPLTFLDAYSGKQAIELVRNRDDIAVILMDVVMDTHDDGLRAVDAIRSELNNHLSRIILRTGHPGEAPENEIIQKYDIDDYKEKTDLTKKRLFTSVYAAVRSYRDLRALSRNRKGLENVIKGSTELLKSRGISEFAKGVLMQISSLMQTDNAGFFIRHHGFASLEDALDQPIVAATGRFESAISLNDIEALDPDAYAIVTQHFHEPGTEFTEHGFVHCIQTPSNRRLLLFMETTGSWNLLDRQVLELFSHNVSVALDHLFLNRQVIMTQKELILMLGEAIESRSQETGKHVHRVAEYSALLAQLVGLPEEEVETLRMAAPLHDIGKIAIEDAILNKPARHTPEESLRMREHASIGANILNGYNLPILDAAGIVASGHHENWDGTGYPDGKAGQDIHIYGRIVALTDVFDALTSERCYKKAWSIDKALEFVQSQRGIKFDPELVDLLCENLDTVLEIRDRLRD